MAAHRVDHLIADILAARERFIALVGHPTPVQATFRPTPDAWSITDNVEHLAMAERSGTNGMWKALDGISRGTPVWSGDAIHRGQPIATVIANTWREREVVPPIAAPSWGGPVAYWIAALRSGQVVLDALGAALKQLEATGVALDTVVYPHPISGPLDVWQHLEFLTFHIDRHSEQVRRIIADAAFPVAR